VRELLADGRCSRAVLAGLPLDRGRGQAGAGCRGGCTVSAVSELEVRERLEEQGAGSEEPDAREEPPLFLPTPDFMAPAGAA